jgi:hypothetical protein
VPAEVLCVGLVVGVADTTDSTSQTAGATSNQDAMPSFRGGSHVGDSATCSVDTGRLLSDANAVDTPGYYVVSVSSNGDRKQKRL